MVESRTSWLTGIVAAVLWAAVAGCGVPSSHEDGPDAGDTDTGDPVPLTAVDLLIVVDDTDGMMGSQWILESNLFALVGALIHPLPTSAYGAVDDLRIAAVTTNMGFSSDGVNNDAYWPGTMVGECSGFGDDGRFQTSSQANVELTNDVIPCDESAAQCPPGWTCVIQGDVDGSAETEGEGVCHTDGSTTVYCPALFGNPWAETSPDEPNADLSAETACLTMRGTNGCMWEQPLASLSRALTRENQTSFVRDGALLAVIAVGDEDDCSLADGQAMFAEDEVVDQGSMQLNLVCDNHPEHLFSPTHFYDAFTGLKPSAQAVVYAAIAGVPYGDQPGAGACEGSGDSIGDCLTQEEMQSVPELHDGVAWHLRPACTRSQDEIAFVLALPGRRFVELATDFGANGYVYSICNADWTPAFDALAEMIADKLAP